MQSRLAITYALALALATGLYAATAHLPTSAIAGPNAPKGAEGTTVPLSWAPDWLVKPLSRAIADATDPRERDKETGLPKGDAPKR